MPYVLRRGLGDGPTVVTDPTTGEQKVVIPGSITTANVYASGTPATFFDSSGQYIGSATQSATDFINQNAVPLAIGGGVLLLFLMMAKR